MSKEAGYLLDHEGQKTREQMICVNVDSREKQVSEIENS
jgi:hypothetical protein